jgi:ABC-type polysaccharide transport system permease subunit
MRKQDKRGGVGQRIRSELARDWNLWVMILPVIAFYVLFLYAPMFGLQIAFKNYRLSAGIWGSPWTGFGHFTSFFESYYFVQLIRNTLLLCVFAVLTPVMLKIVLPRVLAGRLGDMMDMTQTGCVTPVFHPYYSQMELITPNHLPYFIESDISTCKTGQKTIIDS